jgi:hypothetical protein
MNDQTASLIKEDYELSASDKFVSLFTEPSKLFTDLSHQKPKTTDWLIPLIALMLLAMGVQILVLTNPTLKHQAVQEQLGRVEAFFDDAIEKGQMTQEQADQQLEASAERMDRQMKAGLLIGVVTIIILAFLFFFVVSGVFILIVKFGLKGEGTYKAGLTAYGLPGFIMALQLIITMILMLTMSDIKMGTDAAKILGYDVQELNGYLLSYVDPIKIWFYVVVAIAFAKMFKSENIGLYISTILGVWFFFGIAFYGLAQVVPFLKFMIQ